MEWVGRLTAADWWSAGSAITAAVAAALWFASAIGRLPVLDGTWKGVDNLEPFYRAVRSANRLSALAAVFAGLSAVGAAGAGVTSIMARLSVNP